MAGDAHHAGDSLAAARLAAIVNSSDDAIVGKTVDGVVTSWNRGAHQMFGYTAEEAIGRHITFIIPADRHAEEDVVLARIRRGERVDHFETIRRHKDGRLLDISLTISPIHDADGRLVGASKIARNIGERRRHEREREALSAREREAREVAESLNRAKDQFLATLSHELRTPLNAIYGWAQMLDAGRLDAPMAKRATQAIVRNATAQVQLIEDLLDLSRIITGHMHMDLRPVDMRTVIERAIESVQPAARAKGIRVEVAMDATPPLVMGAPARLQQVVWNLLINAVKFTPGGGRITVALRCAGPVAEVTVSDTGLGIDPQVLPRLFERFHQADSSITRPHGGLGIGLALVRHLVEMHGGSVSGESAGVGHGATFTVRLPLSEASMPAAVGYDVGDLAVASAKAVSLLGLRVLVVDDDADSVEMATIILVNAGAETRASRSVADAIATLEHWWADILVADIEMPGTDGFSLLRRARSMTSVRGKRLPALALTAHGRTEDRMRILSAGFNLHLVKPIDPAELVIAVGSLAGRTGAG
jgi:PAS domain S-box-containing protein